MKEAIAFTSGKGGVGKSSTLMNMGYMLSSRGYKVCLIDMDLGLKNLDIMMGLENRVIYDIHDVMNGYCSLKQALIKDKHQQNLYLLPACKNIHIEKVDKEDVKKIVNVLKDDFDYVLLDSAAGLEAGFKNSLYCADRVVVVATLDYTSLQDCDRVIALAMREVNDISLVLNKVNPKYIEKGISVNIQEAISYLSIPLLGVIYEDEEVMRFNNKGLPLLLNEKGVTYSCFDAMHKRLLGDDVGIPKFKQKSMIKRLFKQA